MDLRELQLYKLEIMNDIADICTKHHLKYFLIGGTLLGCIRHDGFIPWDDDVDIALFWDDYLELLSVLKKECPERYFVQNIWTEKNYPCLWTQIRVNGTTSMPVSMSRLKIHWGICIDVFPLISLKNDDEQFERQQKDIRFVQALISKEHMLAVGETAVGWQKYINLIPSFFRRYLAKRLLEKAAFVSDKEEYVYELEAPTLHKRYHFEDFQDVCLHKFEQYELSIPVKYDSVLTCAFGDYMTPPPPEQQGGHELLLGETIIDAGKDYSEYQRLDSKEYKDS